MENKLTVGSYPFPCICLNCGAWYERHSLACPSCGQQPDSTATAFYEWCLDIEKNFRPTNLDQFRKALVGYEELHYGWSDTVLAFISAIGLGILSNASYDVIKAWLLARKEEFLKTRFVADYDMLVELVVDYLRRHPTQSGNLILTTKNSELEFRQTIFPLIEVSGLEQRLIN
jgi:hypothetical protein